jgi:hypothetical protein
MISTPVNNRSVILKGKDTFRRAMAGLFEFLYIPNSKYDDLLCEFPMNQPGRPAGLRLKSGNMEPVCEGNMQEFYMPDSEPKLPTAHRVFMKVYIEFLSGNSKCLLILNLLIVKPGQIGNFPFAIHFFKKVSSYTTPV